MILYYGTASQLMLYEQATIYNVLVVRIRTPSSVRDHETVMFDLKRLIPVSPDA